MSSLKLTIEKKDFKVDKKNGRVICFLTVSVNDSNFDSIYLKIKKIRYSNRIIEPFKFTARGVAVCSKDDTFNENIGKMVAANKARLEAYNIFKCLLLKWKRDLEVAKKDLDSSFDNLDKFVTREKSRLKELFADEIIVEQKNDEENGK